VGEAEALVLAIEKHADFVLMDESLGRNVAQELGMTPLGVVGILLRAKERHFVDSIIPLIDSLQSDLDFFISPSLRQEIILRAGE
jgi:predicted nucleic acid-binding protein